jgi:AcrR family transcriptional regulator
VPRAGLTPERVVAAAEGLADEVGLGKLTLAELAARLGVRLPSLYKHVNGMEGLQREISVRAKAELAAVLGRSAVGRSGPEAVRAMSAAYRAWARQHPGRYAATQRAPAADDAADQEATADAVAVVLDVLGGFGLGGVEAIDATRALRSALHGFVSLEADGGFGMPVDIDRSFARMIDGYAALFGQWASTESNS